MILGIPKERKILERRVALTPEGTRELTQRSHSVLVEAGAGLGSQFSDDLYRSAGAEIEPSLENLWKRSEMIVKVKEPDISEYPFFRSGLVLFDYLHLASMPALTKSLLENKMRSIAYELVTLPDGRLPLLEPMSEVAGKLAVINGANLLLAQHGGRGMLISGVTGVAPAEVYIIGAGIAGRAACEVATGMGARVTLLDLDVRKLDRIRVQFGANVTGLFSNSSQIEFACKNADLLISTVLVPGAYTPKLITRKMVQSMKPGSVFVDVSIDQGGSSETIRPTSLDAPTYVEEGVVHYGVCNMPAQTPLTSTLALTAATLPYILRLANMGPEKAIHSYGEIKAAVNTWDGKLTNSAVSQAVGIPYAEFL